MDAFFVIPFKHYNILGERECLQRTILMTQQKHQVVIIISNIAGERISSASGTTPTS